VTECCGASFRFKREQFQYFVNFTNFSVIYRYCTVPIYCFLCFLTKLIPVVPYVVKLNDVNGKYWNLNWFFFLLLALFQGSLAFVPRISRKYAVVCIECP
jgi:hypothetical protein